MYLRGGQFGEVDQVVGDSWMAGGMDSFETAKDEFGLDHNETRSWHGWRRHVSLVMLAFAMMAAICHYANAMPLKEHRHVFQKGVAPDLLVDAGNPSYRDQARTTAHPTRAARVFTLASREARSR